ncbi:MAG: ABC transporter ATP-binding protein [Pseudomonadota bacterium]|nr:ABC transporter ATP-binding protein [Pseudomonadota bacterium]
MNINCKNIGKIYIQNNLLESNCVLKDIHLNILSGEIVALKGPSGSGKTTLLNIISGLDNPTSGEILFDNVSMNELSLNQRTSFRNKNLGIIFQFFNLLDDFNVYENIAMPLLLRKGNNLDIKKKVYSIADEIGILDKMNSNISLLSGGESQRVAIARSIIGEPKIILADEPTGNLDKENTNKVINLLVETCKRNNTSLLMVTHDTELLTKFEKVYSLESGSLI